MIADVFFREISIRNNSKDNKKLKNHHCINILRTSEAKKLTIKIDKLSKRARKLVFFFIFCLNNKLGLMKTL